MKNEKRKALANKFPLPSCYPAHPPKLDESIVCLIPKTARSYNRFLSKLQQFSMDVMGPLIYLQEQMEAKTQVEGVASFPGAEEGEERAPGTLCLHMRVIIAKATW